MLRDVEPNISSHDAWLFPPLIIVVLSLHITVGVSGEYESPISNLSWRLFSFHPCAVSCYVHIAIV